jgi:hypothetical protein
MLAAVSLTAQLSVSSISIQNGAVNVPLQDTLWITFNKSINTAAQLGMFEQARFLKFMYGPMDQMRLNKAIISTDTTKIGFPYTLASGRVYQFTLEAALAKTGERLAAPVMIRFSTGGSVMQASISGKVLLADGSPARGFTVFAYNQWALTSRLFDEPWQGATAQTVADSAGNYALPYLPDGSYYVRAIGSREQISFGQPNFRFGFYDADGNRFPDLIKIDRNNRQVSNVAVSIGLPVGEAGTTGAARDSAQKLAASFGEGYQLVTVASGGTLDSTGRAPGWMYHYRNSAAATDVLMYFTGTTLTAGLQVKWNGSFLIPINGGWVNSDVLMPEAKAIAAGMNLSEPPAVTAMLTTVNTAQAVGVPNLPKWVLTVSGKQTDGRIKTQVALLNALTGTRDVPVRITAKAAVDSVQKHIDRLAAPVAPELVAVNGQADASGKADFWSVMYYTYASKTWTFAMVDGRGTVRFDSRRDDSPYQPPKLRGTWLDSPAILDSSAAWKNFAAGKTEPKASMNLKTVYIAFPPDTITIWSISAGGPSHNNGRQEFVNENLLAATGKPYAPGRFLAFDGSENAISTAKAWKQDAALVRIGAGGSYSMADDGRTPMWAYQFVSASRPDSILNMLVAGTATRSDFFLRRVDFRDTVPVPVLPSLSGLINSDQAMEIAETSGGTDFRAGNPSQPVVASLDQIRVKRDSSLSVWAIAYPYQNITQFGHFRVAINAATGEIIRERSRTTDRAPFEIALKAAQEWSRDAQFRYAKADSVNADGLVEVWTFGFWSPAKQEALFVEVTGATTITKQWVTTEVPRRFAKGAPIRNWLESINALAQAENAVGANLRRLGLLANVQAELTNSTAGQGKITGDETAAADSDFWAITYIKTDGHTELANVGETGAVTTDAEQTGTGLPKRLELDQNYPNPFNPSTTIRYSLPAAGKVTLEVYNLIGQKVASLVNGTQSAGTHQVSFDASQLSSGIYFYRITAGSQTAVRRMTLVK